MRINKKDCSIILGNALEHFDTSIYALLAPIFAPLFFPSSDSTVSLILAYSVLASSIITKPIGSVIFGYLAKDNPKKSLSITLIGVAISSLLIGLLPDYNSIGVIAPILLLSLRMFLTMFGAGENTIANIYLLEGKKDSDAIVASGHLQSSTVAGIILASVCAYFITLNDITMQYWRAAFILSSITGFVGIYLRRLNLDSINKQKHTHKSKHKIIEAKYANRLTNTFYNIKKIFSLKFISIVTLSGFSHITYSIPFIFLNSFVPLVTDITLNEMLAFNTVLLIFDMICIPVLVNFSKLYKPAQSMLKSIVALIFVVTPGFYFIESSSILHVTTFRTLVVLIGVYFLCPYNLYKYKLFETKDRYVYTGLASAIGSSLFGKVTPTLLFSAWHYAQNSLLLAAYVVFICILCICILYLNETRNSINLK